MSHFKVDAKAIWFLFYPADIVGNQGVLAPLVLLTGVGLSTLICTGLVSLSLVLAVDGFMRAQNVIESFDQIVSGFLSAPPLGLIVMFGASGAIVFGVAGRRIRRQWRTAMSSLKALGPTQP